MKGLDVDDCGKPLDVSSPSNAGRSCTAARQGVFLGLLRSKSTSSARVQRPYAVNQNKVRRFACTSSIRAASS